jgi:hypothetical protein
MTDALARAMGVHNAAQLADISVNINTYTGKVATADGWDITPIINNAINDCITNKKALFIPEGNWYTSQPIRVNQALNPLNPIDGFSMEGVFGVTPYNSSKMPSLIKPLPTFPSGESILDLRYTTRSALKYIGIDGLGMNVSGVEYGERTNNNRTFPGHSLETCSIHNCHTGVAINNAGLMKIKGNNISGNSYVGIGIFQYGGDSDLEGNYINTHNYDYVGTDRFTGAGIVIQACGNINIRGGKIEWNAKGIVLYGAFGINIDNVNFDVNKIMSIYIEAINMNTASCLSISIDNCRLLAGGVNQDGNAWGKAHIHVNTPAGARSGVVISATNFKKGGLDSSDLNTTAPIGPALWGIRVEGNGQGDVTIVGNDLLDCSATNTFSCYGTGNTIRYSGNAANLPFDIGTGNVQWTNVGLSGATANRPTQGVYTGMPYFDTTLGKPIWYSGSVWKDATGATV